MTSLRKEVTKILGILVEEDEKGKDGWDIAMNYVDGAGIVTSKVRNRLILLLLKRVEALERDKKTNL